MDKFKKLKGEILPQAAWDFVKSKNGFKYSNGWCAAYYKGNDPETATDWIVVTTDGGFYKVNALYMIWSNNDVRAAWTNAHVNRVIKAIRNGECPPVDPKYQT